MSWRLRLSSILVLAAVVAPFTRLRVGLIGFGEILFALVFLHQLMHGMPRHEFSRMWLTRFWLGFLAAAVVGMAWNHWLIKPSTSTGPQILFDLGAYTFLLAVCFAIERLAVRTPFDVARFGRAFFYASGLVFGALYVASFFTGSIFGMPLRYYDYFVPLADNLHQISMSLVPMPFIGLALWRQERGVHRKIAVAGLIFLFAVMSVQTGSAKASLSLVVGAFALAYSWTLVKLGRRLLLRVNLAFGAMAVMLLATLDWVEIAARLFDEEDVGATRRYLYTHAGDLVAQSPLFGRGPGPHIAVDWHFVDAHQTFLTVLLQSGFIGLAILVVFLVRMLRTTLYSPALFAAFAALMVYAAGGDVLRRLPVWVCLFVILYWSRANRSENAATPPNLSQRNVPTGVSS